MTILEMNIYHTLIAIEEEKARAGISPCHALLIGDNLQERVEQRMGQEVTFSEFYRALQNLSRCRHKIHLGDTSTDMYAKVLYREIPSSL